MSCSGNDDCNCGCCTGISTETPQTLANLPGLASIAYRAGTWTSFRESMLARLSSSDYPALAFLKTRESDDFTIAFLDATAVMLDILTFYQERLANESYLRTASQLRSLVELVRLIGYQPAPGVAAVTYLAFTLKAAPGLTPNPATPAITIPAGTQVQSVPAQGKKPLTFETFAPIPAKADWNALAVQTGTPWQPQAGHIGVYLEGTSTQLQPGDLILIVGDERLTAVASNSWDVRVLTAVAPDPLNNRTHVMWSEGLGHGAVAPSSSHPKFYALRQRGALFGYNAVDPNMLDLLHTNLSQLVSQVGSLYFWNNYTLSATIDLDATYSKIVPGSWLVLIRPDASVGRSPAGYVTLYRANSVSTISRAAFGMSAKITSVAPDLAIVPANAPLKTTTVYGQSDNLPVAEQPLLYPLYGTSLDLETVRLDLVGVKAVALSGKNQKLSVGNVSPALVFASDDGSASSNLNPGDTLTVADVSALPISSDGSIPDWSRDFTLRTLFVLDANGRPGLVANAQLSNFTLVMSGKNDPSVGETALVSSITHVTTPFPHTRLLLKNNLLNCYDRTATTVNANVGLATHGQTVSEVMGNGSAATPNQDFTLKQSPLTFVQAATPTGRLSTLLVRANSVAWKEVSSLYQRGPSEQVFATLNQSDATTDALFGDGVEGATLPTGVNNIQATYRIGSGSAGNVAAGTITTLIDRPLGVSGVNNPQDATGGQDAQTVEGLRANAPQTVLTLGRAVSLIDYQNFAANFAGIAKASAIWIPSGPGRGVFLTVAGVNGVALPPGNPSLGYLVSALRTYGNPVIPIHAVTFIETLFSVSADVNYDPAYDQTQVEAQILQTLNTMYGFLKRTFGQGVSADGIAAIIQGVPGVVAVNVTAIPRSSLISSTAGDLASEGSSYSVSRYNQWTSQQVSVNRPGSGSPNRICPYVPTASPEGLPQAAEILVLNPKPGSVVLGVMQ